jgi:hypothetical protein
MSLSISLVYIVCIYSLYMPSTLRGKIEHWIKNCINFILFCNCMILSTNKGGQINFSISQLFRSPFPLPPLPNLYLPISITILFRYFPPYLLICLFFLHLSQIPFIQYIYWKRVNSYRYGGPHLISDFDFIISVYMLSFFCLFVWFCY